MLQTCNFSLELTKLAGVIYGKEWIIWRYGFSWIVPYAPNLGLQLFKSWAVPAHNYSKVGRYQPWGGKREEYLGSECIIAPSWQLHTITLRLDIYLKSIALFKFFCVCHSTMDTLCEILALQKKLLLTAWISCIQCGVEERLFLPCVFLKSQPRPERSECLTKMNGGMS